MSKGFQFDGQIPCKVVLDGPTRSDPRAIAAIEANASEIARFQIAAREGALRSGVGQSSIHTTTSTGIQLRYVFNQGQEFLLVYVPLTNPQSTTQNLVPEQSPCVAVVDVLFPGQPYLADYIGHLSPGSGGSYTSADFSIRHTAYWASGIAVQRVDETSLEPYGTSQGSTPLVASAAVPPPLFAAKMQDLQFGHDITGPSITLASSLSEMPPRAGVPNQFNYVGPATLDGFHIERIGNSYIIDPITTAALKIKVSMAHANNVSDDLFGLHAEQGVAQPGFVQARIQAPIIIRVREYPRNAVLSRVSVEVTEQILNLTLAPSALLGSSTEENPARTWHFVADQKYTNTSGAAPAAPSQPGMGKVVYSSDTDPALLYATSAPGWTGTFYGQLAGPGTPNFKTSGIAGYWVDEQATYDSFAIASPPITQFYNDIAYDGPASSMTQFATITYTPGASPGGGKVTASYM